MQYWISVYASKEELYPVRFVLIVTSILVGAVAVLLYRRKDSLDPKVFLAAALLNAGALLGILFYKTRCK